MRILRGLSSVRRAPRRAVVTLGVFDGVHLAHQKLIRETIRHARRHRGTSVVITFHPDPQRILNPAIPHPKLMPIEVRLKYFRELGVDLVWVIPFTKRFARMQAAQFIKLVLIRRLNARMLIIGKGFVFGQNRHGGMEILKRLGSLRGMRVVSFRPVTRSGRPISSSRIRRLIGEGRLTEARHLLGRPPELFGSVVRGVGRGRRLTFPTANLKVSSEVLPPRGVYAVMVQSGKLCLRGVLNVGVRPTFGSGPQVCEVHLIGFSGRLNGRSIMLSLFARLRAERRFASAGALRLQIQKDIVRSRDIFTKKHRRHRPAK